MNISKTNIEVGVYVGFIGLNKVYKEVDIYNYKDEEVDLITILCESEVETYEIIPISANRCNMFIRVNADHALLITKEDVKEASKMWENDLLGKLIHGQE